MPLLGPFSVRLAGQQQRLELTGQILVGPGETIQMTIETQGPDTLELLRLVEDLLARLDLDRLEVATKRARQ